MAYASWDYLEILSNRHYLKSTYGFRKVSNPKSSQEEQTCSAERVGLLLLPLPEQWICVACISSISRIPGLMKVNQFILYISLGFRCTYIHIYEIITIVSILRQLSLYLSSSSSSASSSSSHSKVRRINLYEVQSKKKVSLHSPCFTF